MKFATGIVLIIAAVSFSTWLFFNDQTASPRPLTAAHARKISKCNDCHTPWEGVSSNACKKCHEFKDYFSLRPAVRFHQAGQYCLKCHTEHLGMNGVISEMDHTLLNDQLLCAYCHLDPHQGLFGRECRQCHGLSTWQVKGYKHPPLERQNCTCCHRPPVSHTDEILWQRIQERHRSIVTGDKDVQLKQCWQCHVIHSWRHLRMSQPL